MKSKQIIPLSSPDISPKETELVNQVLRTPYISMGSMVGCFEEALAQYTGANYAVAVSSGTGGLHLAVIAAGIGEGDLVITSPFSFVASSNCLLYERAIPVFVDVDERTGNIDPTVVAECAHDLAKRGISAKHRLPSCLRSNPQSAIPFPQLKLKGILPVHVFGQPCAMAEIAKVAKEYGLVVIEDACESLGARLNGKQVGTFGDCGVVAFYANKQITTGEGGVILTDREDWAVQFRSLRNQGRDDQGTWMNHVRLGYNYRLDELSAALGVAQMARIDELITKRAQVAGWYNERLGNLELIERPFGNSAMSQRSWFVYVVRLKSPLDRDQVITKLEERGIPSRPYFTPIHLQPFYKEKFGYNRGDFPIAERLGDLSLALPFSGVMTEDQVDYVCTHFQKIIK